MTTKIATVAGASTSPTASRCGVGAGPAARLTSRTTTAGPSSADRGAPSPVSGMRALRDRLAFLVSSSHRTRVPF
jgi:hypothetical protein